MTIAATDEAEGAQAMFCYIADRLGAFQTKKQFTPYMSSKDSKAFFKEYGDIIKEGYNLNQVNTTKSRAQIINYVNKKPSWFVSSLLIAREVIDEVEKIDNDFAKIQRPGWQNLFYQHGDEDIMKVLAALFKSANAQSAKVVGASGTYFGDINKWTPADIYFASNKSKRVLQKLLEDPQTKKDNLTFAVLNRTVKNLILSGDLLPLSLKKVTNHVIIEKVNFSRKAENALLAQTFCLGVNTSWKRMTGSYKATATSFEWTEPYSGGRDIYINIKSGKKTGVLHFRATPASNGKPSGGIKMTLKYDGASAMGGQVASIPLFIQLIDSVKGTGGFSRDFQRTWNAGMKKFKADAEKYIKFGGGAELYASGKKGNNKDKKQFNDDMGAISALTTMNEIRKKMTTYFKAPTGEEQNNVCRAIFQYTGSRTAKSARFVIAKD